MSGVVFNLNSVAPLSGLNVDIPVFAARADITQDEIAIGSLTPIRRIPAIKTITIGYAKNYTPMADSVAATVRENTPDLATKLSDDSARHEQQTAALQSDVDAVTVNVSTLIVLQVDAATEAQHRLDMALVQKRIFELQTFSAPFLFELGDSKTIDHPDYFTPAKSAVITRIIDQFNSDQTTLEIEV